MKEKFVRPAIRSDQNAKNNRWNKKTLKVLLKMGSTCENLNINLKAEGTFKVELCNGHTFY